MSAKLLLHLNSNPSAQLIVPSSRHPAFQSPLRRNHLTKPSQSESSLPQIATEPSTTDLHKVDIGTSAVSVYRQIPVYNVHSVLKVPSVDRSVSPGVRSVTNLLRKRYTGRNSLRPVTRGNPGLVVAVTRIKHENKPIKLSYSKASYEPLSRINIKTKTEGRHRSSLSYWR